MSPIYLIAIFIAGIISGFIGAVSGGGGIISISLLLALGIPPQITLASNKFGGIGLSMGALYKYIKEKKIIWKYVVGLTVAGILGSLIGSKILIDSNQNFLKIFTIVMLLLLVPTVFMKRNFGTMHLETSKSKKILGYFLYFLISIIASFFGGFGMFLIVIVVYFLGLPFIEGNATELVSYTAFSIVSTIIFMINGLVNYYIGILLFIGMTIGGYIGAHTAIKKGNNWVKAFFVVMLMASIIKVLLS
jgi:uncharacterized membrane protein YfcA